MNNYKAYVKSLVDPHDVTIDHPKLHDGIEERSAGLRFRQVTKITCKTDGPTYILVFPGITHTGTFFDATYDPLDVNGTIFPAEFPDHYQSPTPVKSVRCVGCQAKFQLLNSPDESDGMFEAVRLTLAEFGSTGFITGSFPGAFSPTLAMVEAAASAMEQQPSYSQGRLRDIHRYNFRNNFNCSDSTLNYGNSYTLHGRDWDIILIRITGRSVAGSPSILTMDTAQLQEVLYNRNTGANRLMTTNIRLPDQLELLVKIRYAKAAFQIN